MGELYGAARGPSYNRPTMTEPRTPRKKQPLGQSIGGVLFGFEQQVWRNQPPPHELVHHARPDDPLPAGDGGFMTLDIPDLLPGVPAADDADAPPPPVEVRVVPRDGSS
jgi:hypothetical protein